MDGDGSGFSFPSADFNKQTSRPTKELYFFSRGQDANTDISWGDMFLDGIHSSDDPNTPDTVISDSTNMGANVHGNAQMVQQQHSVIGGQLQVHIPSHFQNTLTSSGVQQASTSLCGTVAYLASAGSSQHVQPINSVLLQSNQTLAGQTIYSGQGGSLFPAQGSVHIENPKVVNVNFGPHVIGSDGSGQQAIIQTAEGKRVLITNSQLQHMSQSISLSQPIMGTQLINPRGGNVIQTNMAPSTTTRQIVLPTGQTVIPRQNNAQTALPKNMVIRQINPGMSPVIYQTGQSGQLIQPQPTLITSSGTGLQVVNTGGTQGSQVQLIAQPNINQTGLGQQQNTIMNFINNQSVIPNAGNQITGLVPGQNIFVNGQMLNLSQLSGLTMSQLQVQPNTQVTLANINTGVARPTFQPTTQHLVIQHNGQQQQILIQPKNAASPSLLSNASSSQRTNSNLQGNKLARTPTPNASSASSTPVATPTPSTPTSTSTPDLMSDYNGQGSKTGCINILEQALEMSDINLHSFEDEDFMYLENQSSITPPPSTPVQPAKLKPQPTSKAKSKTSKPKSKTPPCMVNVTVSNNTISFQQPKAQLQSSQGQKVTLSPKQKVITADGQVYVLSANGQQLILQPSPNSANSIAPHLKPIVSQASTFTSPASITIPSNSQQQLQGQTQQVFSQTNINIGQLKVNTSTIPVQQNTFLATNAQDSKVFIKTNIEEGSSMKIQSSPAGTQIVSVTPNTATHNSQSSLSPNLNFNQGQTLQFKNQKISTLGGTIIKQEPISTLVKQEPVTDFPVSQAQVASSVSPLVSVAVTTSNIMAMTMSPVDSSASSTATSSTLTTQSHKLTIMATAQMTGSMPTSVSSTSSNVAYISTSSDTASIFNQALPSPNSSLAAHAGSKLGSTSKEKDPNNVKVMTPIKIADSTLMLSLTPVQKKRLEDHLSCMSMKDQNEFLLHQQSIIRRSQQVQQKQLEQQQKYQKLQHIQQHQQMQQQQPILQLQVQQQQVHQQQQQTPQPLQLQSHTNLILKTNTANAMEISPNIGSGVSALPTTVQELMDKPEEVQPQQTYQDQQVIYRQQAQVPQQQPQVTMQQHIQYRSVPENSTQLPAQHFTYQQMGRCLAEQQLLRDKTLAQSPDVSSAFKSLSDAMRRLVRYHTLQDHKPEEGSKEMRTWDTRYSKLCEYLVKKKRCYMRRFHKMKLYNDMCPEKQPEYYQNIYCFNEQLREQLEKEKEQAKNFPDTFEPVHQTLETKPSSSNWHSVFIKTNTSDVSYKHSVDLKVKRETCDMVPPKIKTELDPDIKCENSCSPCISPQNLKRKLPDKSSGTLKLVFKRRTTDNFIVKNSLGDQDKLPNDFKPVVNLEKSDSEYEFDSQSGVTSDRPVIVRRRTSSISVTSRQTSFEGDSNSSNSESSKERSNSSFEDEEEEQEVVDDDEEEEDEDDEDKDGDVEQSSSEDDGDDVESFSEVKRQSKGSYHVSFDDEVEQLENNDAFMAVDESATQFKDCSPNKPLSNNFEFLDLPSNNNLSRIQKSSRSLSHSTSVISDDVFNSNLSFPAASSGLTNELSDSDDNFHLDKRVDNPTFSFSTNTACYSHRSSTRPTPRKEFVAENSVNKDTKQQGLPNSSIFTTPSKSLLQTDAMFNSSEDEDDDSQGGRLVSAFEIDNKDPQSSMMNDSVRSAINSVLNDDDNDDSQTSWSSSAHRPPSSSSSSIHHSLYQQSPAIPSSHDADLDAAVQSILNS
ncbi:uncharacterized protein LOC131952136 isoform X2 [Physella acuta]|uniref:uncharacterized protein LOC131952136 isoform X2 n=1 Tax=Physella acuta TaxID=109671 RepID=UPI0027DCC340|nr:uncharacterized protein LOC131952136 isoform X2 [Physella acuta]